MTDDDCPKSVPEPDHGEDLDAELAAIMRNGRGNAGGVEFDLTHERVPPSDWKVIEPWQAEPYRPMLGVRPFFWFPWYGNLERWRREFEECGELEKWKSELEDGDDNENDWEPECIIEPGDKISIECVEIIERGKTRLDAPADAQIAAALLIVTRSGEVIQHVETPLPVLSRNTIAEDRLGNEILNIRRRVDTYFARYPEKAQVNEPACQARRVLDSIFDFYLGSARQELKAEEPIYIDIVNALSQAATAGYLWAKAEAYDSVLPLAEMGAKASDRGAKGGKAGGARRRQNRPWTDAATRLANKLCFDATSQFELAGMVIDALEDEKIDPPGETQMKKHIREMEQQGDLPRYKAKGRNAGGALAANKVRR